MCLIKITTKTAQLTNNNSPLFSGCGNAYLTAISEVPKTTNKEKTS